MMTKTSTTLLLSLFLMLPASAQTPKLSPTPQRTAAETTSPTSKSPSDNRPSPAQRPSLGDVQTPAKPTPAPTAEELPSPTEEPKPAAAARGTPAPGVIPNPVLYLMFTEPYTAGGKNWIRYRYDVANKEEYPAEMFAAAPSLPPCGSNTNSSRTWVDFFDSTGKRLYGFCALGSPANLGKLWFALEEGVIPPSYVYIELNDRQANKKYKSNLADTTM